MDRQEPTGGTNRMADHTMLAATLRKLGHFSPQLTSLATRGAAVVAGLAVTYLIGRQFGAAATGQYALITQTAAMFATAGLLGLDVSVVRHLAKAVAKKVPLALSLLLRILAAGFGMMAVIALALALGGETFWRPLFGNVVGIELLLVLVLMIVGRGGANLLSGLLRAQHRFALAVAVSSLVIPLVTAVALVSGLADNVHGALQAAVLGGYLAVGLGLLGLVGKVASKGRPLTIPMRTILASSLPLWGASIAQVLGEWYGLAVAARMLGATEAGLYRVSFQIASMSLLVTSTLFSVYSAQISAAFHAQDRNKVALLAQAAIRLSAAFALPFAVIVIIFGQPLLGLIGPEFRAAYSVLVILALGQLTIALLGPCGIVLAMSGHERTNLAISIGGMLALLALVPLGARLWGMEGIALCVCVVLFGRQLLAFLIVRSRLGIQVWSGAVRWKERKS